MLVMFVLPEQQSGCDGSKTTYDCKPNPYSPPPQKKKIDH